MLCLLQPRRLLAAFVARVLMFSWCPPGPPRPFLPSFFPAGWPPACTGVCVYFFPGAELCWASWGSCWSVSPACWSDSEWQRNYLVYQLLTPGFVSPAKLISDWMTVRWKLTVFLRSLQHARAGCSCSAWAPCLCSSPAPFPAPVLPWVPALLLE